MNESGYTAVIKKLLEARGVYCWKINDRITRGIADLWVSGSSGDMWIEFKWSKSPLPNYVAANLSPHQQHWLQERHKQGRCVFTIMASPTQNVIFHPDEFNSKKTSATSLNRHELVNWICEKIHAPTCPHKSTPQK